MASIHETAYPRFKPYFTLKELDEVFSLSLDEVAFLNRKTKITNTVSRLGFALLLKCYQYLGRPIKFDLVPANIKKYVARQLVIDSAVDLTHFPRTTFRRHKKAVREYLEISNDLIKRRVVMKKAALESAQTKENLADIINRVIEELLRQRFELPAYQSLVRLTRAQKSNVQ